MQTSRPSNLLVETDWLTEHLDDPSILIADCRFVVDEAQSRAAYASGHIPGAVHVYWLTDLCMSGGPVYCLLPTAEEAAASLGRLGMSNDKTVVAYASEGQVYAARLWHVLAYYGHERFKLLNGGIEKWVKEGRPLSTNDVQPKPVDFRPGAPNGDLRIRADELVGRLDDSRVALVDARRLREFEGTEARSKRGGRIPGAKFLPWEASLRDDLTFRTPAEIRAIYEAAGITPDREIVTYCQGGARAAHAALALKLAGYPRVRVYDGSWAEWGNDESLPMEQGPTGPAR